MKFWFIGIKHMYTQTNIFKKKKTLTAHVLVSLKMGALSNPDTTAMTAWRLFMSHSFYETLQDIKHTFRFAFTANVHRTLNSVMLCVDVPTLAVRIYRLSTSARIFSVCACRISRTTQKLVWKRRQTRIMSPSYTRKLTKTDWRHNHM